MVMTAGTNQRIEFWEKYGSSAVDKVRLAGRADFNLWLLLVMQGLVC
jgi:hypothetical protein